MHNILLSAALLAALAGTAGAHATLEQKQARAGSTGKITLRVPHGCAEEATHTIRLSLPEGFYAAKPMPKAGWELSTSTGAYAKPFDNHGTEMTHGVREVVWSGGHLESGWYDEFTVRGTFGRDIAPGTTVFFPAVQECDTGVADWTDTSGSAGVANPAPSIVLTAADTGQGAHHGQDHGQNHGPNHGPEGHGQAIQLGDLTLSGGFTRATLPNAPVAGGFVSITNSGTQEDRLLSARATFAKRTEIHEMIMTKDVMKMRELPDGLPIAPGATVELKPGGYHIMFMGLEGPLEEGKTVTVTLDFENAGTVDLPLSVGAPNARAAKGHSGHGGHGMSK